MWRSKKHWEESERARATVHRMMMRNQGSKTFEIHCGSDQNVARKMGEGSRGRERVRKEGGMK
jgi:hypothetical protein